MRPSGGGDDALSKMLRQKADPLAALSDRGQRLYAANGSIGANRRKLEFEKVQDNLILIAQGFVFDRIDRVCPESTQGSIPADWFHTANWVPSQPESSKLPEEFWRTLVADRGSDLGNVPPFYERACEQSAKDVQYGDSLDTAQLIDDGGSKIVTKFLERVQAVISGRSLVRTMPDTNGDTRLGLVYPSAKHGDYLCILYGCSVPVVLRKHPLDEEMLEIHQEQRFEKAKQKLAKAYDLLSDIRLQQLDLRRSDKDIQWWNAAKDRFRLVWIMSALLLWTTSAMYFARTTSRRRLISINGIDSFLSSVLATSSTEWQSLFRQPRAPKLWWLNRFAYRADLSVSLFQYGILSIAWIYLETSSDRRYQRITRFLESQVGLVLLYVVLFRVVFLSPLRGHTTYIEYIWRLIRRSRNERPSKISKHKDVTIVDWKGNKLKVNNAPRNHWSLIGPAYVHGMMDGEAIQWRNLINVEIASEQSNAKKLGTTPNDRVLTLEAQELGKLQNFHLR